MKIRNKYTSEVKEFEYDVTGQNEAARLISTGEWEKVKANDFLAGYSSDILTGGINTGFEPNMTTGDIDEDWDDLEW